MPRNLMALLAKIQSGGQTGPDWAALDWATQHAMPHGRSCPMSRRAEDGPIDSRYQLKETPSTTLDTALKP